MSDERKGSFRDVQHLVRMACIFAAGVGLLSLTVVGPHSLLGLVGVLPLATGLAGFCPLHSLLRLDTLRPSAATK